MISGLHFDDLEPKQKTYPCTFTFKQNHTAQHAQAVYIIVQMSLC